MGGLYIHVPFCHAKCAYCDFYSQKIGNDAVSEYLVLLEREWMLRKHELFAIEKNKELDTVYFGGGTPSVISPANVLNLREWLPEIKNGGEFTVEFNPEDVYHENTNVWKTIGANRVSMGIQSLIDDELRAIGRRHTAKEAIEAFNVLRYYFANVSIDIIIGLPGQTYDSLRVTLFEVLRMHPEHISAYILSYEPGTRLWAMRKAGKIVETDDETIAKMYDLVCDELRADGYEHYEVSNFALPGYRARHNSAYWTGSPYLGLGPGAHSYDGHTRRFNPSNLKIWTECLRKDEVAFTTETESEKESINTYIMTGLRTANGIDISSIPESYRTEFMKNLGSVKPDRFIIESGRLFIPERAWLTSDDTISRLFL